MQAFLSGNVTAADQWEPLINDTHELADQLDALEEQLHAQLWELPAAADDALERSGILPLPCVGIPLGSGSTSGSRGDNGFSSDNESSSDSGADSDDSELAPASAPSSSTARIQLSRKLAEKENEPSSAKRLRARGCTVVSYATAVSVEDSGDEYIPDKSGRNSKLKKGKGRASATARGVKRVALIDDTNALKRRRTSSREVIYVPASDEEVEALQ